MPNLVQHIEFHCGRILHGWSVDGNGRKLPFQVVETEKSPIGGVRTLTTLGVSTQLLRLPSGKLVRQEFVMLFREESGRRSLPSILQTVGLDAMNSGRAWAAREVIGPRGPLLTGTAFEALYVAIPVYFPESFHECEDARLGPIIFAWLVPITRSEAEFVRREGWDKFEDLLEEIDPDLTSFDRGEIVGPDKR